MSHLYKQKAVFWLAYSIRGKLYRESLKTKDKATAKYLQAKKDQGIAEGRSPTIKSGLSCLDVLAEYQKSAEHRKARTNYRADESRIRKYLTWSGARKLSEITEKSLIDYLNTRINAKKSPISLVTANNIITNVKTFLGFAVRWKHIHENPIRYMKKYRLPVNPPRFLAKDEVAKVLREAKQTDLYPCVAAAIYTGMRKSELFNLEWRDIDFDKDTITVQNKDSFTTKSKRFRLIPLHPALKSILRSYRLKEGRCFDTVNQRRVFGRIMRKAGLGKDVGWHTLRHTFASSLVMAGVDLVTVSKLMGHSTIATTMIYAHLTGDHVRGAVERLRF